MRDGFHMLIKDAIQKFLAWRKFKIAQGSIKGDDLTLRYFGIAMKNCDVELVSLDMILEWLQNFSDWDFDQNTILKKCVTLHKFFEFLKMQNLNVIDKELIPIPRRKFVMPRVADDNDLQKLIDAIPTDDNHYWHKRNKAFILIQSQCGARIGEVLSLDVGDLDDDLMGATIETEKSRGKRPFRKLMWRKEANEALKIWLKHRQILMEKGKIEDKKALWISLKGGKSKDGHGNRMEMGAIKEIFRKYSSKAGLGYIINSHSLRHKMGRDLAMKGANNATISSILGHAQLSSSFVYSEIFGKDLGVQYKKYFDK